MKRPYGNAPWEEYLKYILHLEAENKELNTKAQDYGEFCVRCDRTGLKLLTFEDFKTRYK